MLCVLAGHVRGRGEGRAEGAVGGRGGREKVGEGQEGRGGGREKRVMRGIPGQRIYFSFRAYLGISGTHFLSSSGPTSLRIVRPRMLIDPDLELL